MWLVALSIAISMLYCGRKGEVGWYTHPKGENSMVGCKNPSVGSFLLLEAQLVLGNSHLTS